jgi:hypothetical protein
MNYIYIKEIAQYFYWTAKKASSSCVGYIFELSKSFSEDDRDTLTNSNEKT